MSNVLPEPQNLAEAAALLAKSRRTVLRLMSDVMKIGPDVGEMVNHAYDFAGYENSAALAQAAKTLREAVEVHSALETINVHLSNMQAQIRQVQAEMEESEQRRRAERTKLAG